jgi:tripeptidyl-peptidase-1
MISNLKNAEYWVITNNYWVYEMAVDFFNMTKKPDIISISYGWAESGQCSIDTCGNITSEMYVNRVNIEFAKISLTGTSIVVSSGDAGAPGRTSEQCQSINPIFPGSSEWVTSVGATYLYGSGNNNNQTNMCQLYGCNNGNKEYPINYNAMAPYSVGWTTGGGFAIYPKNGPIYQNKYKEIYKKSGVHFPKSFNFNGRMYPDISIVGHNCFMVLESGIYAVDGTSCSAPIMASFIGLMMQEVNSTLGCVNQLLYYMYDKDPTIYNDITNGYNFCTEYECCSNNYGFYAAPGPDAVSGLGTPNMGKILHFMTELSR